MNEDFQSLIEHFREISYVEITGTRTNRCMAIEFRETAFPQSLVSKALGRGLMISGIAPDNELADDDSITVWFSHFSTEKTTVTVEVEKDASVLRTNGDKFVTVDR